MKRSHEIHIKNPQKARSPLTSHNTYYHYCIGVLRARAHVIHKNGRERLYSWTRTLERIATTYPLKISL